MALNEWALTLRLSSNQISFDTSLALKLHETSTCCSVACKISIFLPWLPAPKHHQSKGQCPHHGCPDPNPDQPQTDSIGLNCQQSEEKHIKTHQVKTTKLTKLINKTKKIMIKHCRLRTMIHLDLHLQPWSAISWFQGECSNLAKHAATGLSTFVRFLSVWFWTWHVHFLSMFFFNTSRFVKCEEFESVSWYQFSGSALMTRCWCCWTQRRWCGAARRGLIQQIWPRGAICYPFGNLETWWRSVEIYENNIK